MNIYIPIIIVVLSNTLYHIFAKSTPDDANTFVLLSVTYAVAAAVSVILALITKNSEPFSAQYKHLNWSSFALGIAIVGLESGFILMYKAGWNISTGQLVASAILAVVLLVVGILFYKESFTVKKAVGLVICLAGLYLLNKE